jgi:hypothetical protein
MTFVALEDAYGLYVVTGKALMTRAVGWIECRWGWRYSTIEDDGQALDGPITKSRLAEWFPEYTRSSVAATFDEQSRELNEGLALLQTCFIHTAASIREMG